MPITGAYGGIIGADNVPSPAKKVTQVNASGCFNRTMPTATVVVVAGGGGGSQGGGGAGGVLVVACHPLPASAVPVTIGAGGADTPGQGPIGAPGTDTTFGSATPLTAQGGMGGGGGNSNPVAFGPQNPIAPQYAGGLFGSGGGSGGTNPAQGGRGRHPNPFGGCNPVYEGSPGSSASGSGTGGGGGADDTGYGKATAGGGEAARGGRGRDLTPLGVPTCIADCGFVGGGGGGRTPAHPSNPHSLMFPVTDFSSHNGKLAQGGGGRGQTGIPSLACAGCTPGGATTGTANTGGGGGAGGYPGADPFPADFRGRAGGSGTVIVIEDVAGSSANSGIYNMKEQYICVKSSRW